MIFSRQEITGGKTKAQLAAGAGPDMGGAAQGGSEAGYGDDVVDADYKEV